MALYKGSMLYSQDKGPGFLYEWVGISEGAIRSFSPCFQVS